MAKRRVDTLLAERGMFPSRSRAAASVMAGQVRVGDAGRRAQKPGEMVDVGITLSVDEAPEFVSRGGTKLANALAASGLPVSGRLALDVGASTGGFTDCLLKRGARAVVAVDVAYGALDLRLREDRRVHVIERTNARALEPSLLPGGERPDLAVIDVSFISLRKVLGPVTACLAPEHDVLALVKPQFEVGRGQVGKGGVVRDPEARRATLVAAGEAAVALGARVRGYYASGLPGPKGNLESFIWFDAGTAGAPPQTRGDLELLAREAEPA